MPSAFNIIRSYAKLPHSLRCASFGVATAPAASRLRALKGSHNSALCLAPLRNCSKHHSAPGAARSCQRAKARGKGGVKRCGPGAARTVSAPRRESKSNERAPPKGKASAPEREEKATSAHRARRALPSVRGKAEKNNSNSNGNSNSNTRTWPTPRQAQKAWPVCSRAKTSTPTQRNKQRQRQKVRAWSGAYLQRAKARQRKPGKSNGNGARHGERASLEGHINAQAAQS
jgi:hypothetical protein